MVQQKNWNALWIAEDSDPRNWRALTIAPSWGHNRPRKPGEAIMTITIGAICDSGKTVLLLSDRQLSRGDMSPLADIDKFIKLTNKSILLTSGSKSDCIFIEKARQEIIATHLSIEEQAGVLVRHYFAYRNTMISQRILSQYGFLSLDDYYLKHNQISPPRLVLIEREISLFSIGVELILGGFDSTGSHVYYIGPGGYWNVDALGYAVAPLAMSDPAKTVFLVSGFSPIDTINTAVGVSHAAKKWSESQPGVGKKTDIWIINKDGSFPIIENVINTLDEKFQRLAQSIPNIKEIMGIEEKMSIYNNPNTSSISQT